MSLVRTQFIEVFIEGLALGYFSHPTSVQFKTISLAMSIIGSRYMTLDLVPFLSSASAFSPLARCILEPRSM